MTNTIAPKVLDFLQQHPEGVLYFQLSQAVIEPMGGDINSTRKVVEILKAARALEVKQNRLGLPVIGLPGFEPVPQVKTC